MKTSVTKIIRLQTAHQLTGSYAKECQKIHGHSYKCEVTIEGDLNSDGMVVDFKLINETLKKVEEKYDHNLITEESLGCNPTAENMAVDIFRMVKLDFIGIKRIRLWETDSCFAQVSY